VLALAWAGSQVTKIFRLGGAVLLAPATGSLLDRVQERLKLGSRGQAVRVVVVGLLSFTALVFSLLILQGSFTYSLVAPAAAAVIAQARLERNAPRMNVVSGRLTLACRLPRYWWRPSFCRWGAEGSGRDGGAGGGRHAAEKEGCGVRVRGR
jgi:hypothetical protein